MGKQERWAFSLPATQQGHDFIKQLRKFINSDSYSVVTKYTGPRPNGTSRYATTKANATSIRVYVESKRDEDNTFLSIQYGRKIQSYQDNLRLDKIEEILNEAKEVINGAKR